MDLPHSSSTSCKGTPAGTPHCELCQATQRIFGAVGMDRRERPAMSCIERVEEDSRFRPANLSYNDPVRPVAKCSLQQIAESDLALVSVKLGLGGDDVRLPYIEFGHIFKNQDAVAVGNKPGEDIGQSRFSGPGSARDQEIVAAPNCRQQASRPVFSR